MFKLSANHFLIIFLSFFFKQCLTRASISLPNYYNNYRLYSVRMPDNYELKLDDEILSNNQRKNSDNLFYALMDKLTNQALIDFWDFQINQSIFAVSPSYYVQVEDYLLNNSLDFNLIDENIQNRLNQESQDVSHADIFNINQNANSSFKLNTYHQLNEINDYLLSLANQYPDTVKTNIIGKTFENRDILSITIGKKGNKKRPNVIVDAGIHPREWITQASALVLISKLVYYFNINASHTVLDQLSFYHNQTEANLVTPIDWTIVPVLNPDGYQHTWSYDRLYRKNRAIPKTRPRRAPWNFFKECLGTDLNRNFEYYFAYSARSTNPCNDIFSGDAPFSEKESSALKTLVFSLRPQAYISLHSFSQLITFPNQINRSKLPNHDQLKEVARRMSLSMRELESTEYRYGQISQFNYAVIGDSVGWANLNGVNLTFRIDLRDKGALGYLIPKNQIVSSGEEVLKGLIVIADEIVKSFKGYY